MRYPSRTRDDRIGRRDALRTALIVSALFWGLLVATTNSDAEMLGRLRRVLGDEPNGLRFDLNMLLFTIQLAVPMIYVLYHALITLT
jgi:hypothetical protein